MYNDYLRDPKIVAVIDGWSLFRGIALRFKNWKWDPKIVVAVDRWSLFGGGR